MKIFKGLSIRMNVAAWYKEVEFQDWFNSRLGAGLATWHSVRNPLVPLALPAATCNELAQALMDDLIAADVLFEPFGVGTLLEISNEQERLKKAEEALDFVHERLLEGGKGSGIPASEAGELLALLRECILEADVFFEPCAYGDSDAMETEESRLNTAEKALERVRLALELTCHSEEQFEYSDCFVGVDPSLNGEGTDSDMPEKYWREIVKAVRSSTKPDVYQHHIVVQLAPVEDDDFDRLQFADFVASHGLGDVTEEGYKVGQQLMGQGDDVATAAAEIIARGLITSAPEGDKE